MEENRGWAVACMAHFLLSGVQALRPMYRIPRRSGQMTASINMYKKNNDEKEVRVVHNDIP